MGDRNLPALIPYKQRISARGASAPRGCMRSCPVPRTRAPPLPFLAEPARVLHTRAQARAPTCQRVELLLILPPVCRCPRDRSRRPASGASIRLEVP